jgi:phosphoribosyl 1,2-cyclic phosphate phosphodiesterase
MHGNLQVFGYRVDDLLTYWCQDNWWKWNIKTKNLKVLVVNAEEPHFSHLNLEEALDLIALLKPEKHI